MKGVTIFSARPCSKRLADGFSPRSGLLLRERSGNWSYRAAIGEILPNQRFGRFTVVSLTPTGRNALISCARYPALSDG